MQFPPVSHLTQATWGCPQHTVVTCTVAPFWSSRNIWSWIWLVWQLRCSRRYEISHDCGLPMNLEASRSSQASYYKCEEEQHKADETLLNLRVFQRTQLILQVFQCSICLCGKKRCRGTSSLWKNSFHVPRWSCSAPAWQVTGRAWSQTSAAHWQTHHLMAKHAKDFMPHGRDPC